MGEQLALRWRPERLVGTLSALHARLAAHPGLPLVIAARRPAARALCRFLPAAREHIHAPAKKAGEQRELALRRPQDVRLARCARCRLLSLVAQLIQLAGQPITLAIELAQPCLHRCDRGIELSIYGHRRILPPLAARTNGRRLLRPRAHRDCSIGHRLYDAARGSSRLLRQRVAGGTEREGLQGQGPLDAGALRSTRHGARCIQRARSAREPGPTTPGLGLVDR